MRLLVLLLLVGLALAAPRAGKDDLEIKLKEEPKPDGGHHKEVEKEHQGDKSASSEEFSPYIQAMLDASLMLYADPDKDIDPSAPVAHDTKE